MGDRMFAEYEIINVQKQSGRARANVTVGHYKYDLVRKWKSFNYWYYLGYALCIAISCISEGVINNLEVFIALSPKCQTCRI